MRSAITALSCFCALLTMMTFAARPDAQTLVGGDCTMTLTQVSCPPGEGPGGPACSNHKYHDRSSGIWLDEIPVLAGNCDTHNYLLNDAWVPCPLFLHYKSSDEPCVERWVWETW